jgi:periplasmic divalent cation tolerance protein
MCSTLNKALITIHSGKIRAMSEALVILCTCPDEETATRLGSGLVRKHLAACVNVLPGIRSIYLWQGTVNADSEVLMVIKTVREKYQQLEDWLGENHPYDVPEIVALPVGRVSAQYFAWIEDCVGT